MMALFCPAVYILCILLRLSLHMLYGYKNASLLGVCMGIYRTCPVFGLL